MRRIVFLIIIFSFFVFQCSEKPSESTIDILKFYNTSDSTGYINYIDGHHWNTRTQLSGMLDSYLSARADNDSAEIQKYHSRLSWLLSQYERCRDIRDLSKIFNIIQTWDSLDIRKKLTLDSLRGVLSKSKDSLHHDIYFIGSQREVSGT